MHDISLNIKINKKPYLVQKKLMILQVCNANQIEVPRFCFHEKLNIAGNCRLCLVEIEKFLKPAASCAYPVMPNLEIFTNTLLVKKAREGILEFLLINHPLDCPICDWGGECDLQDQVLLFGNDRGRFYEQKRAVEIKYASPMIKMLMTRCIHCTRCVRFLTEISGDFSLGTVGRGNKMEISNYLNKLITSDISGNIIDLCPVGALTSVPYLFKNRPWKVNLKVNNIDLFDSVGSNIYVEITDGQISRILPKYNSNLNDEWISDKIRFFYDSLTYQRLGFPAIIEKNNKKIIYLSWENAFLFIKKKFKLFHNTSKNTLRIVGIFGSLLDIETLISFKDFINKFGSSEIYSESENINIHADLKSNYLFSTDLNFFSSLNCCFFIGIDLAKESPIFQLKLRKILKLKNIFIFSIGSNIKSSIFNLKIINLNFLIFFKILEGKHWVSTYLTSIKKCGFIFGSNVLNRIDSFNFQKNLIIFNQLINKLFIDYSLYYNFFLMNFSKINGFELGISKYYKNIKRLNPVIYYLLDVSTLYDKINILKNDFIIYQGYSANPLMLSHSHIILPSFSFLEKNIIGLNIFNNIQLGKKCLSRVLNSQNDIFIFVVLGFFLNKQFSFFSKFFLFKRLCEISPIFIKNLFLNSNIFKIKYKNVTKYNTSLQNTILLLSINCFYKNSFNIGNFSKNLLEIIKSKNYTNLYILK